MKNIGDVLQTEENRIFVGRRAELSFMRMEFDNPAPISRIIHFHGPGGIGKSALLTKFSKELKYDQVIWAKANETYQKPQQFLEAVIQAYKPYKAHNEEDAINWLNRLASAEHRLALFLDSMECWEPIESWFCEYFLPRLSPHVRLFTSGRYPLWMNDHVAGKNVKVKNIVLNPLDHTSVHQYILASGIHQPSIRDTVARLSNGIPLALSICVKAVLENERKLSASGVSNTIQLLCRIVLEGAHLSPDQRKLLEAASAVWRFDQSLLTSIVLHKVDDEEFHQFCNLPFVMRCTDGWSLLDGIRNWIRVDFRDRAPETFQTYKQRAFEYLYRKWISEGPDSKAQRFIEVLYGIENDLLRDYYYRGGHIDYELKDLPEDQLSRIEQLWRDWFPEVPPFQEDNSRQELFFRQVWEACPSAFTAFWDGDSLAAFDIIVPLNQDTRAIFSNNAPYRNYILNSPIQQDEVLIWIGAPADKNDFEASCAVFRHFLQQFMHRKLFTLITPVENHMSGLLSLGFVRLHLADYESAAGEKYYVLQLDTRNIDLYQILFGLFPVKQTMPHQDAVVHVKEMLMHIHNLESEELLLQRLKVLLHITDDCDSREVASIARTATHEALRHLEKGSETNAIMARSIELAYFQRSSHEEIAEYLHLSLSTFYRYLRKGIERVALFFITHGHQQPRKHLS